MAIYKDTYVKGDTTMSDANGKVVGTRVATHDLPLIVAPVLPLEELFSVETIRVTLPPGSFAGPIKNSRGEPNNEVGSSGEANDEVGSGEANDEACPSVVSPGVVSSFRISRVDKVNSTAVVFHAVGGEQIRVRNGVTTVWNGISGETPVCSANVTCAAFQVEGAELAEKYLAEALALLAPFEEGRRRLGRVDYWSYACTGLWCHEAKTIVNSLGLTSEMRSQKDKICNAARFQDMKWSCFDIEDVYEKEVKRARKQLFRDKRNGLIDVTDSKYMREQRG